MTASTASSKAAAVACGGRAQEEVGRGERHLRSRPSAAARAGRIRQVARTRMRSPDTQPMHENEPCWNDSNTLARPRQTHCRSWAFEHVSRVPHCLCCSSSARLSSRAEVPCLTKFETRAKWYAWDLTIMLRSPQPLPPHTHPQDASLLTTMRRDVPVAIRSFNRPTRNAPSACKSMPVSSYASFPPRSTYTRVLSHTRARRNARALGELLGLGDRRCAQ